MSIIGKSYIPFDNSYTICLSTSYFTNKHPYFAGTVNSPAIRGAVIISEPYTQGIVHDRHIMYPNGTDGKVQETTIHTFVNILYQGHTYRVLYTPKGVEREVDTEYRNKW